MAASWSGSFSTAMGNHAPVSTKITDLFHTKWEGKLFVSHVDSGLRKLTFERLDYEAIYHELYLLEDYGPHFGSQISSETCG
jgi:hypothetical protein